MQSLQKKTQLRIGGMTCTACQNRIERRLQNTAGITEAAVSYNAETANITYDAGVISLSEISLAIKQLGYRVLEDDEKQRTDIRRVAGILILIVVLYILLSKFGLLNLLVPGRLADTEMGYGMLIVIGLITSVHCIAMCGGINLTQSIPRHGYSAFLPSLLYNLGRVISYTLVGFILGFVSMQIGGGSNAGLPVMAQGLLKIIAGIFMVIMGINMLGIFPVFRKLMPRMPNIPLVKNKGPLMVGLLNGLMPCGPLQSIQIVALASGSPLAGALSMFLFSVGTVPLMLGLGSLVSALGKKFTVTVMKVGAVLVTVLGLAMLSQGGSLSGLIPPGMLLTAIIAACVVGVVSSISFDKVSQKAVSTAVTLFIAVAVISTWGLWSSWGVSLMNGSGSSNGASQNDILIEGGIQVVHSTLEPGSYPDITVKADMPVRWIIDAPNGSINGCNNRINIQEYNIMNYAFDYGENVIEFTPDKAGRFLYSCWMGMLHGSITVEKQ